MFFYIVLTPISTTSGLWSTGNTRKYHQIDVCIYQCEIWHIIYYLNNIFWNTDPNSKLFHRNVPHDTLYMYHNCSDSSRLNKMATTAESRNTSIFRFCPFNHRPKHNLLKCHDFGEPYCLFQHCPANGMQHGEVASPLNRFKASSKIFYWPFQGGTSFVDLLCFFCLAFAMPLCASVYMYLVATCWERVEFLALVCGVWLWVSHFSIGILAQVCYLIVSIPDLCTLTYFHQAFVSVGRGFLVKIVYSYQILHTYTF